MLFLGVFFFALEVYLRRGLEDIRAVQRWCLISYADEMMANGGVIGYIIVNFGWVAFPVFFFLSPLIGLFYYLSFSSRLRVP